METVKLMKKTLFLFLALIILSAFPHTALTQQNQIEPVQAAQGISAPAASAEMRYRSGLDIILSDSAVISMVTVYPGDEIYSLFGHSSFRVLDPEKGIDWMYNYGTFDFSDPLFVPKFTSGRLDYYLDINSFQRSLRFYANVEKRRVFEQVLSLDRQERQTLFDFLQENGEPENMFYRYDFIWDNCSTRIALALDMAFPGQTDYSAYSPSGETFRQMIRRYLRPRPFTDFGIQLVLGFMADRKPQGKEVFFLPVPMMDSFSAARFGPDGRQLVLVERELAPSGRSYEKKSDYPLYIFTFILAVYAAALAAAWKQTQDGKPAVMLKKGRLRGSREEDGKLLSAALFTSSACEVVVLAFTGIAGIVIFYLWFLSDHDIASSNLNILWCSPLNLFLAFLALRGEGKVRGRGKGQDSGFCNGGLTRMIWITGAAMCALYLLLAAAGAQQALPSFVPAVLIVMSAALRRAGVMRLWHVKVKGHGK